MSVARAERDTSGKEKKKREREFIKEINPKEQLVSLKDVTSAIRPHVAGTQLLRIERDLEKIPFCRKETIGEVVELVVNDVLRRVTNINPDFMIPGDRAEVTKVILAHLER